MRRLIAAAALFAIAIAGRGATAAETIGWITFLDQQTDQIVLDNGQNFSVSDAINFSSLRNGVKVWIRYVSIDGDKVATEIAPASGSSPVATFGQRQKPSQICDKHASHRQESSLLSEPSAYC